MLRHAILATTLLLVSTAWAQPNLAINGDCERVEDGKPVSWGTYDAVGEWGSLQDGHQGKGIYFIPKAFTPIQTGDRAGEDYRSCAIVLGSPSATDGAQAFEVISHPDARLYRKSPFLNSYHVEFWIRNEASLAYAYVQTWTTDAATAADRGPKLLVATVPRTDEWIHCQGSVALPGDARRFCLMFQVHGYSADGLALGRVCVDDVIVRREDAQVLTPDDLPRISIPDRPAVYDGDTPIEDVLAAHRAGEQAAVQRVTSALEQADRWAAHSDEWYRQFFRSFEPRGVYTVTCPIHPFKTRYYNDFSWSLNEPWTLVCEHCKAEGRKYYSYPNPDYPDDGDGCKPTDEVWARTHDEAWSKAHDNIPHDHWDGSTHGDSGGGRRFYFLGKYYVNALLNLQRDPVRSLALGWHYATKLFDEGTPEREKADLYAHRAKIIMLCEARAYLGDDYLAAAEGITPEQFAQRMVEFYQSSDGTPWQYEKLAGFRPFNWTDTTVGDPLFEDRVKARPYGYYGPYIGAWNWRAMQADNLLVANCMLREAFGPDESDLMRICQRPAVSMDRDRERVAMGQTPPASHLKRGCVEMELQPYSMVASGDNLAPSTLGPVLRMGLMLRDDKIIENVARDVYYFWRNHFTQDGLGPEGSPTYTSWGITSIMQTLYGMDGDFDEDAPYYDRDLGGLNLFRMPQYKNVARQNLYYMTEDGYYIAWEDSVYNNGRFSTRQYELMERYGGGIPEPERDYFHVEQTDGAPSVSLKSGLLPPRLLHDRRKAILRAGEPAAPTTVALNYTKACGHLHHAVQDLVLHACGLELASDLGYLGSDHFLRPWLYSHAAHNCLCLRKADGDPDGTTKLRGDIREHFVTAPHCQIVDTAEYDAADWQDGFEDAEQGELSRQVILMVPSEEHQYVIDIARGRGGEIHDYYFHCHGLGFEAQGIELQAADDPQQSLYDYSGFGFKASKYHDARVITNLSSATTEGPWQATWSRIDDYRGQPKEQPLIHDDAYLRLWMVDEPGSELIVGDAPAQRWFKNEDIGRKMKTICLRRPNTDSVDTFIALMEPYRESSFIRSVRRLETDTDDEFAVALAIETMYGTDYLVSYGGPDEPPAVSISDGGHEIATDADIAVLSYPNDGPARLLMSGGTYLQADAYRLTASGPRQFSGTLVDFNDDADTLTVETQDTLAEGDVMAGQPIIIHHSEDRSSFTIKQVERTGDGRYIIHLDATPHLVNNWLLVKKVDSRGIVVEPPPVLDAKQRTYKVYAGPPDNMRMLGPLQRISRMDVPNEFGTPMARFNSIVTDSYDGVEPGQEIGITRLEKGRDTFSITNMAYLVGADV